MTFHESPFLAEFTVQEIQLELIRRTQRNALDGAQVVSDLLVHPEWWEAVLLDSAFDLVKLRDLGDNIWNADTLLIVATNAQSAKRLAELGTEWLADDIQIHSVEDTRDRLGTYDIERQRLVTMWWD